MARARFAFVFLALLVGGRLIARDVPEPPLAANPIYLANEEGRLAGSYHDLGYLRNVFRSGEFDLFSIRQQSAFVLYAAEVVAATLRYGSLLFVGPVAGEIRPGSQLAPWYMHSIQFEYGVAAGFAPFEVPLSMTVEYARTSQHPLMAGFSEVSSDILSAGAWFEHNPRRSPLSAVVGARFEYVDLFDFWQSTLRAPRTAFRLEGHLHGSYTLFERPAVLAFLRLYPRLLVLRTEGQWAYADVDPGVQTEGEGELGLALIGRARVEFFGFFYATQDTEQRRGEAVPSAVSGLGVRFTSSPANR
ncbi:MAG: hypothetical protein ACOC8L_11850 [Spirochaetota bacterium]